MDTFCKIIKRKSPAYVIYEDKQVMAILDIEPISPGHTLIIPKRHFESIEEIDPRSAFGIFSVAARVAKALRKQFKFDGIVTYSVSGKKAQDIPHFHLHVYGKNSKQQGLFYRKFKNRKDLKLKLSETAESLKRTITSQ